ncbi:MAG: hypothetical protein DRI61_06600 [Chloroflexi bacterium]|nr:MAG: hypothetical protein DRI61_06600 [Chloroflexota bacterium]
MNVFVKIQPTTWVNSDAIYSVTANESGDGIEVRLNRSITNCETGIKIPLYCEYKDLEKMIDALMERMANHRLDLMDRS